MEPKYPNTRQQRAAANAPGGNVGGGSGSGGGGGGGLFFGNNFILASASTNESPGGAVRLPRIAVYPEPGRRPSASRGLPRTLGAGDPQMGDFAGGLSTENTAWGRWSRERRASIALRQQREARDSITLAAIRESVARGNGSAGQRQAPPPYTSQPPSMAPMRVPLKSQPMPRGGKEPKGGRGKRGRRGTVQMVQPDLSMAQWSRLLAFWQHPVFARSRIASMVMVAMSLITGVTAISCRGWSSYLLSDNSATSAVAGLWDVCFVANGTCISSFDSPTPNSDAADWLKSVASLLVSSVLLAAIASVVAVCGFWASYLPRKIYFFHSAGEMFLVCAVLASIGVGIYPYALLRFQLLSIKYNYGYGLGWVTVGLQYLGTFTMMLDMLVRESSRPRPCLEAIRRRLCGRCCG